MYTPHVGRWLSQDPAGFVDGPNRYLYVANNPTRRLDPSGMEQDGTGGVVDGQPCRIAIHCWQVEDPFFGFGIQKHCGLTVNCPSLGGTVWVDGGPTGDFPFFGDALISWQPPDTFPGRPNPPYHPHGFIERPFVDYDPAVGKCLKEYAAVFTAAKPNYELISENSNWALRCMTEKCGVKVDYPPKKPRGWDCQKCLEWRPSTSYPVQCCLQYGPCPCPK